MSKAIKHNIRKKTEFKQFIKVFKDPTVIAHWVDIADILGVDNATITRWKKEPEAIEALRTGIEEALFKMQYAGAKDWKMWESKLRMLGINPPDKGEVNVKITEIAISREPRK